MPVRQLLWLLIPLVVCVPWDRAYPTSSFFEYELHLAYGLNLKYGTDLVPTYGPWGFLGVPFYHPGTYVLMVAANLLLLAFTEAALYVYFKQVCNVDRQAGFWTCCAVLPLAFVRSPEWAPLLFVPVLLTNAFVLRCSYLTLGLADALSLLTSVALGLFACMKLNNIVLIGVAMAAIAAGQATRRQWPTLVLVWLGAVLVWWRVSGQPLGQLVPFMQLSSEVVSGYREGMQRGSSSANLLMATFVLAALLLGAAAAAAGWRQRRAASLLPSAFLVFSLYNLFLCGFVRADAVHIISNTLAMAGLFPLVWPLLRQLHKPDHSLWPLRLFQVAVAFLSVTVGLAWYLKMGTPDWERSLVRRPRGLLAQLLGSGQRFAEADSAYWNQLRHEFPLPDRRGTGDTPTGNPDLWTANQLLPRLHPTLTNYAAYTPALASLNRAFLESEDGPTFALLERQWNQDTAFPTIPDNYSYLTFLSHFQVVSAAEDHVLFERRDRPRTLTLTALEARTAPFGAEVEVPAFPRTPIWVEVEVDAHPWGQALAGLFKPPPVQLHASLSDGRTVPGRLIPAMARHGFLLSPLLVDLPSLGAFYRARQGVAVERLSVELDGPATLRNFYYKNGITIRFYRVEVDP